MYHYVRDMDFLAGSYPYCARLVNQLVQHLRQLDIHTRMLTIGNRKRGLITQNDTDDIHFDFYLIIQNAKQLGAHELKEQVIDAFNEILDRNWLPNCDDTAFGIATKKMRLPQVNQTQFWISLSLITIDADNTWHRLIHFKTENILWDEWYWSPLPYSREMTEMEYYLKPRYSLRIRKAYLEEKEQRRESNGSECVSLITYLHALNKTYEYALQKEKNALR